MFFLIKRIRAHLGHDKYSAETFDRLLHSMHVEDLDWVVSVTTYAAAIAIALIFGADYFGGSKLYESLVHASAVLAVLGAVVAWCYQTGSSRLGMVDLFACEITTLCRICTINGLADTCIAAFGPDIRYDKDKIIKIREQFGVFTSSETYTPFFDANAKELHSLSVKVLANITAFYTYWKATRDAFRKLADIQTHDGWHRVMCDIMYMQFLAFESARKAVRDLIEFEPNNAENKITIFISELPLYGFLLKHFQPGDLRHARLKLRQKRYEVVVPQVYISHCKMSTQNTRMLPQLGSKCLILQKTISKNYAGIG